MTVGTFHSARKQWKLIRNSCGSLLEKGERRDERTASVESDSRASAGKLS
jgi:hypothetical protein